MGWGESEQYFESALCNRTAHTYDRINVSQRPSLVIEEVLKRATSLIGRDFPKNLNVKLAYLCELSVLCERPPHIPSLMHNLGPLPMRERLAGSSAFGTSWIVM